MGSPYIGEIRMFAGNYNPAGWAFCNGQLMPISENDALFVVLGTTYGGDGQETFALPNLQSRVPLHQGTGPDGISYTLGEAAGTEQETLTVQQIPNHTHALLASTDPGQQSSPQGNVLARAVNDNYTTDIGGATVAMATQSLTAAGGSQPHTNLQPYLVINFIISLFGIFPSPT